MRKTVLFIITLVTLMVISSNAWGALITLGTRGSASGHNAIGPTNFFYRSRRIQWVYTAAEISAAGGSAGVINSIAFDVSQIAGGDLLNYKVKMAHTTATNASSHNTATLTTVKNAHTFTPGSTGWRTITFDQGFVWNGTSNILVDISFGLNAASNNNGQVWLYNQSTPNQMRAVSADNASQENNNTNTPTVGKPRAQLDIGAASPADPDNFSASAVSESQINLSWDLNNDADNVLLAWNTVNTFGTPSGSYSAGVTITGGGTVLLADSPNTGFNHTGLTASTPYYYKIWSLDTNGDYSDGVTANATTAAGPVIDNPEDFNAGASSDEQIDLSWDLNDDDEPILLAWNSSNDFGTPSGSYTAGDPISGGGTVLLANSSNISFNHTGLDANTQYFYKIWSLHEENNVISYSSGVTANATTFDVIIKTFPWMEGFEANSPTLASWTQQREGDSATDWIWATGAGAGSIRSAHTGSRNARFSAWYTGERTKLITPVLDLNGLNQPVLSFWYGQEANGTHQSSLTIFYRSSPSASWVQLGSTFADNISEWTLVDDIILPNPSATYQLAFEGLEGDGHANVLDDVEIRDDDGHVPVELSSFTAAISADNFVNLMWVTQSETGVLGFYVLRNTENHLGSAITVSELISATNSSEQQSYIFKDSEIFEDGHYFYWLQNSDMDGSVQFHGPVSIQFTAAQGDIPELPLATELKPVYPNPFNPMAFIPFSLKESATVNFEIYNARGQLVKRIPLGQKSAGNHRIEWDGSDDRGINCTTGVYHIRMTAGNESFSRKAVLMK